MFHRTETIETRVGDHTKYLNLLGAFINLSDNTDNGNKFWNGKNRFFP